MRAWLQNIRIESRMTQEKVAKSCDMTAQFYNYIENGKRNPSVAKAKAIAALLGFDWTIFYA